MYICQLKNGKMLKCEGGMVFVEETGYPLPDCEMHIGNKIIKGHAKIMKSILSYEPMAWGKLIDRVMTYDAMSFEDFKHRAWKENLGGNCPERLRTVGKLVLDKNLTEKQAFFVTSVPSLKDDFDDLYIPDDDFLDEYKDLIYLSWDYKINKPNGLFKSNILMFKNIKNLNNKHVLYIIEAMKNSKLLGRYGYKSMIVSKQGVGCILFLDTLIDNIDLEYFYSYISGVNMYDGDIDVELDDSNVKIGFKPFEDYKGYYKKVLIFEGTVERGNFTL